MDLTEPGEKIGCIPEATIAGIPVDKTPMEDFTTVDLPPPGTSVVAFISKLYELVNNPDTQNFISWSDEFNKKAIIIPDPVEFSKQILPKFFKHSNICSFVRQLNIYGFHKVDHPQGQCFQHPNFSKERPENLAKIQRQHSKKVDAENTELYKMLLDKLRELQKDSINTQNDLQQLNEMLFTLKNRVDALDTRMHKVGQYINFLNPNYKPFKRDAQFETAKKDTMMANMNPWE